MDLSNPSLSCVVCLGLALAVLSSITLAHANFPYSQTQQLKRDQAEQQFLEWGRQVQERYKSYQQSIQKNQTPPDVDVKWTGSGRHIVVDQNGQGDYMTVQEAIHSVPIRNDQWITIDVKPGVYREKVNIGEKHPYITIQGSGREVTRIEWNSTANDTDGYSDERLNTFRSASFAVDSDNFIARDISFANTAPIPPPGAIGGQAVALRISGDKAAFFNCGFYGAQDTLYDHRGRHYFESCEIVGNVDFIFGDGVSMYKNCSMVSIGEGAITAQRRGNDSEATGFSFVDCSITGNGPSYLGRAWGPYSRVVFARTLLDVPLAEGGWDDWNDPTRDWHVFYGLYNCSGPGANATDKVAWSHELTDLEAEPFVDLSFVDGQTWVPHFWVGFNFSQFLNRSSSC